MQQMAYAGNFFACAKRSKTVLLMRNEKESPPPAPTCWSRPRFWRGFFLDECAFARFDKPHFRGRPPPTVDIAKAFPATSLPTRICTHIPTAEIEPIVDAISSTRG